MGISEKKMQIVINNYFKQECDVNTSIREAFEKGFRIGVKKASSAQPGWIPCSERMPEDGDYKPFSYYEDGAVLFCTKDGKIGFGWYYESTKEWANEDDKFPGEVIAWCPLPEPYRPEGEEQ